MLYTVYIYHQRVLPKGRSFTANSGTKIAVLLGINRCGSFPFLSAPHSRFSIWTDFKDLKRSQGHQRDWLTGPSGLHRSSPQRLNISSIRVFFDQIREQEIRITLRPHKCLFYGAGSCIFNHCSIVNEYEFTSESRDV